VCFIFYSALSV